MARTWLEAIEKLDPEIHQDMLKDTQRTIFRGDLPEDLNFLDGRWVDLGFENLGLESQRLIAILRAFCSSGAAAYGTHWRLRFLYPFAVIELADGSEAETLPANWKEGVIVWGDDDPPTWIGERARQRSFSLFDLDGYVQIGKGWVRKQQEHP
jgi:hypothetical protein